MGAKKLVAGDACIFLRFFLFPRFISCRSAEMYTFIPYFPVLVWTNVKAWLVTFLKTNFTSTVAQHAVLLSWLHGLSFLLLFLLCLPCNC